MQKTVKDNVDEQHTFVKGNDGPDVAVLQM